MVSEIDIRDWEKIDFVQLRKDIEHARYEDVDLPGAVTPHDSYARALDVVEYISLLVYKQLEQYKKQTAALLRAKE